MFNLPISDETKENSSSFHRARSPRKSGNVLGASYHHPHVNSNSRSSSLRTRKSIEFSLSPTSLDKNLTAQGWQNHGNGVYSHEKVKRAIDVPVPPSQVFHALPHSHHHSTLNVTPPERPYTIVQRRSVTNAHSPRSVPVIHNDSNCHARRVQTTLKRRFATLSCLIGLSMFGIFIDVKRIMDATSANFTSDTVSRSKTWIMNLPQSLSATISQRYTGQNNVIVKEISLGLNSNYLLGSNAISMTEESNRVSESRRDRARQRRIRTQPPPNFALAEAALGTSENREVESTTPRLVLDLPAHRRLDGGLVDGKNAPEINSRLRHLEPAAVAVCGRHAKEASQLNPNNYPESSAINSKSRVVVTGALTQLGMELILYLHEQCGVSYVMGIDSAYPNTRHERIELSELRYKHIERRVPGFQRLIVPAFGIHPHPKVGDELKFEQEGNSFNIMRFKPTHVVHLAGFKEGMGEHPDYGDTTDVSPFSGNGGSTMMRRFESLVSMDQVLSALMTDHDSHPHLVYVSSDEASERSGVGFVKNNRRPSASATEYGTSSLIKEILASYYYHHRGVYSVGLRIPTLLGPFARPGSAIHDLAEHIVRNAAGTNVKGVPKYHSDRNRYELSSIMKRRDGAEEGSLEQVAFASDVAEAIVAAMQFRGDGNDKVNGPSLIRLVSKTTTSMKDLKARMESYLQPYNHWESSGEILSTEPDVHVAPSTQGLSIHDTKRNRDLLGWVHSTRLHEGTKSMLAWHVLKSYPFGLPSTVPSYNAFKQIVADSYSINDRHSLVSLPCASGCRWQGYCTSSVWDEVIEVTKSITDSCAYVLYTVDLRPELVNMEKQSTPSQRSSWESRFCKIAFVSTSSKLARALYSSEMNVKPMNEWNGKRKDGYWIIVALNGSHYSMAESERSLPKLAPNHLFNDRVEKAMYANHRRVCLTTDQATGVMKHLEMKPRDNTEKKMILTEDKKEMRVYLPPRSHRHSIFFTNRYVFPQDFDTSDAKKLAKFVMTNMGIAETSDIRAQVQFYEQTCHLTRTNAARSTNYQDYFQENLFPYEFLRTTWLVHELKSEEGRNLRCEMYQEHSMWGNNGMEDLSIGYVLASRKVKMQLGSMAAPEYEGPEEWYPFLVPKEKGDEGTILDGPVYLDYLEAANKVAKDEAGAELYISFLPQKRD